MKPRTLYVSDMDGTLLNSKSVLSDATCNLLNRLINEHHILFTVATARTPATVVPLMSRVQANLPFITMAGAALWDNRAMQYQSVRAIPSHVIEQLIPVFEDHGVNPFIYRRYANQILAHHVQRFTANEQLFIEQRLSTPFKHLVVTDTLMADAPEEAMLVFSMGPFDTLKRIADKLTKSGTDCSLVCYHDIYAPDQGILEIYAAGTNKALAVNQLARQVQANRIVVFGDNLNDLPMMQEATHSVAVANAFEEVKRQAHEIIGTNDEDAVANWIAADLLNHEVPNI